MSAHPRSIGLAAAFAAAALALGACPRRSGDEAARAATPARQGIGPASEPRPSAEDRCPVCAMAPAEHERFASAIELDDGRTYYFCGTGCMIKAWLHPEVYLGVRREALRRSVVREYLGGQAVDGEAVTFVVGSDVVGPMGPALVPLRSEEDVATFRARHGGTKTFRLGGLDDTSFEALTGKRALPPGRGGR